jgi:hypothetical protein
MVLLEGSQQIPPGRLPLNQMIGHDRVHHVLGPAFGHVASGAIAERGFSMDGDRGPVVAT